MLLRILTIVALMAVAASAARGPEATLAPALDSFLERGAKSEAELTAVAEALLDKADEQVDSEVGAGAETIAVETGASAKSDAESDAEAESEAELEAAAASDLDLDAEAEAEADREVDPLATKNADTLTAAQLKARRRARRMRRLRRRIGGAPPPLTAQEKATAAAAEQADRDGIVRMVFDELKRMGASGSVVGGAAVPGAPPAPSPLGVADPRIRSLESRLSMFEAKRARAANAVQDRAIAGINQRLEGLDRTLNALKNSAVQQQKLTDQLMSAVAVARGGAEVDSRPDFSVEYQRAELPGDFEARVEEILDSVKSQARKIYERFCKRRPRKVPDTDPTATPRNYPSEKTAPLPPAKGAKGGKKGGVAKIVAAAKKAQSAAAKKKAAASPSGSPSPSAVLPPNGGLSNEENPIPEAEVVAKPVLFAPIVKGKEPTPEGLRLAKALNDVGKALPLTPAYLLGAKERALHDVLGEDAVGSRWKSAR